MKLQKRHLLIAACFFATFCAYSERVGFSIAYTRMAKDAGVDEANKGRVLSAFYAGYGLSQVPGGACAQQFGGGPTLLLAFMSWSVVEFLTPTDALRHRVFMGIFQGFIIPSVHTVISQNVPPNERAVAISITTSGMYLGSAAAMLILPSIARSFGAGALLASVGSLGVIWTVLWPFLSRRTSNHDHDLHNELPLSHKSKSSSKTPWLQLLSSPAIWTIIVNNFAFHYSVYVVMNWLPTYFNELLGVELSSIGTVKSIPYLIMFLCAIAGGYAGDYVILRWKLSVAMGRKFVNTSGFLVAAIALWTMPKATTVSTGVICTTLVMGALGFSRGGWSVNHMDIAPRFAGIVMGISNTAGTISGVVGVATTGAILSWSGGADNRSGWVAACGLAAIVGITGSTLFVRSAKGERLFD